MNYTIILSLIIILTGIFFRILPYDSVQGLWNDEYVSWFISQKPFIVEFVKGVFSQCHMPLYYLYLKLVTSVLGSNDVILRLSSTIIGLLSILVMYKVGRERDNNFGLLCAFFTSVSGFLIYFSYEVRPYSLIFLFSALSLLYSIRVLKYTDKRNLYGYLISNLLIILTHTIGFIYVFFNILFVCHYLKDKNKKAVITTFVATGIGVLTVIPLLIKIFTTISFSQWWTSFSFSKILFMQTDFYSNYLVNLTNAPSSFIGAIGWGFLAFAIIPANIGITGFTNSLFVKNNYTKSLAMVVVATTSTLFFVSMTGKFIFLTKYNLEVYPIIIYLSLLGLYCFKNKAVKVTLIATLLLLNTSFLFTDNFKSKFIKNESHKLVAELLESANLHKNDHVLLTYYPTERFTKYYDFSDKKVTEIHKGNFMWYLSDNTSYHDVVKNGKNIYKQMYLSSENEYFDKKFIDEIVKNMHTEDKLAIVFLNSVSLFSDVQNFHITLEEKQYNKTPQMFMIFSYIKNRALKNALQELQLIRYEQKGEWAVATFKKG